ncbi:hypothetical protein [Deinococcus soli (ex Cha et al. 2016)]|uniref:Uncharacterized protein n=2 Tax=Deinococcus soli (ex Cha et al. 2016) TaxID=1309411 RepID=A0ACC6KG31_9DEIO|nr:hypothetical protein [Deinococcus soli (ex Cha et al. 2016)]MDR6218422.1 hypothetical protein [Deinococcus soli (ex Cha et al. 2016)]MDR6329162.1 hypothetical protein [Deinococcus soli (ex Cha et al. 2016)]MDR6751435.1 hypothetical protein [Deinococcus soli (ex Cha et al. 2016)]
MDRILNDPLIGVAAFFLLLFFGGGILGFALRLILGTVLAGARTFAKLADLMRLPPLPGRRKVALVQADVPRERRARPDRPERSDRSERSERPDRSERSERPARSERAERPERPERLASRRPPLPSELSGDPAELIDEHAPSIRRGEYRDEED